MSQTPYSDPDDFQDPLENYDPKVYDDPIEEALAEETADRIRHEPMAAVTPETTVAEAVAQLVDLDVACLLVHEHNKLVGVFSHRDVLVRVASDYESVKDQPVKNFMTDNPIYVYDTDSSAAALSVMAIAGYRHVPIVDNDGNLVGIVSPQRVTDFLQQQLAKS